MLYYLNFSVYIIFKFYRNQNNLSFNSIIIFFEFLIIILNSLIYTFL